MKVHKSVSRKVLINIIYFPIIVLIMSVIDANKCIIIHNLMY